MRHLTYLSACGVLALGALTAFSAGALAQGSPGFLSYENEKAPEATPKDKAKEPPEGEEGMMFPEYEPVYPAVDHVAVEWPTGALPRVEALLHGVTMDLPPEYDHYGYEIRRFMVSVGNPNVLSSKKNMQGQIKNIETAQGILLKWQKEMHRRYDEVEAQIEAENSDATVRNLYKYNRGLIAAFFSETDQWMRANKALLSFMASLSPEDYKLTTTEFSFSNKDYLKRFIALYEARERALAQVRKYTPFSQMAY